MNMSKLEIRSFLISCEIKNIFSGGVERAVKPRDFKRDLSQIMNEIIHPDRPNRCPLSFQSYPLMELRETHSQSSSQNHKRSQGTTVLHCRPRRTRDATSKQRPRSWPGGWARTWIQFAALLFLSHVSSGTSLSQILICDGRKYLTPPEVGTSINIIWILGTKITKIIELPLQGAFNPKISSFMGTGSSALLAHLSGICISGRVTEVLLRGHRRAGDAARREQEAARDDAVPVVLLPTETRLEPCTALRLLHRGKRERVCVCLRMCVRVRCGGHLGGQLGTPLSMRDCCPLPPTAPSMRNTAASLGLSLQPPGSPPSSSAPAHARSSRALARP